MHRLPIALTLLLLAPFASAQVYKWTDAGGTVHYSQSPPAQGTQFKQVKTTGSVAPLAAPPAPAGSGSTSAVSQGAATGPASTPVVDTPANRKALCSALKTNISELQGNGQVTLQQNGKTSVLDADQRKQQLGSQQSQYSQYCQSQ